MKKINKAATALLAAVMAAGSGIAMSPAVFAQDKVVDTTDTRENVTVIDVTDFGADPTGRKDSQPAVMEAIAAAKEVEGSVTINFPEGTYQMYPDKAYKKEMYLSNTSGIQEAHKTRTVGLWLEDMNDVVVEGNGSRFVFHNKMTPYATVRSQNVTLQNFSIDFATPTCYEMLAIDRDDAAKTITYHIPEANDYTVSGNTIVWRSDKSPYTGETYWTQTKGFGYTQAYNAVTGESWRGATDPFSSVAKIEDLGDHRVKFTYNSVPNIQEGIVWQTRNTTRDQVAGGLLYSKNVALKNIEENYVHGFGIIVQMSEDITLDGVIFDTPEKSGRATSSSADDINISGVKGKIEIKNSRFHNPHDDPINVHGTFLKIVDIDRANKKVTVEYQHNETSGFPNYFVGDKIEFSQKGTLVPIDPETEYTVVAADGPDGFGGWTGEGSGNKNRIVLTIDKELPEGISANNALVENITFTPDVHIHDNYFVDVPTRGVLCTTRGNVVIEDNTFERMNMAGIYISCDGQGWYESGRATDVTIRNNTFIRGDSQDIYIEPTNPNVSPDTPVHHNINIEGNTFLKDVGTRVLDAKSTDGLTFKNNKILRADPISSRSVDKTELTLAKGEENSISVNANMSKVGGGLYNFNGCKNITIEGNTYDPGFAPSISFGSGTNMSHVTVTNDKAAQGASQIAEDAQTAFVSSNPEVASVDGSGNVTGNKAGKATITSYVISGGRRFEIGKTEVTVTNDAAADIHVELTGADTVKAGESITLSAAVEGSEETVKWSVLDAYTGMAAENTTINQEGVLSTTNGGVVLVKAECGGAYAIKAVLIEKAGYMLGDGVVKTFQAGNDSNGDGLVIGENSLKFKHYPEGLYQEQEDKNKPYLFNIDIPEGIDANDMTVTVKVDTDGADGWGCSGMALMNDADNYVSTELKSRGGPQKFAAVREVNGSASEAFHNGSEGSSTVQTGREFWYRLAKSGDTVTASFSTDGTNFNTLSSSLNGSFLNGDSKVGLFACGPSGTKWIEYSDLTFTSGETTKNVALTKAAKVNAPAEATIALNEGVLDVTCELSSASSNMIVVWETADSENGPWSVTDRVSHANVPGKALEGKFVRAKVYDANGNVVSKPVTSNAVRIDKVSQGENPADLAVSAEAGLKVAKMNGTDLDLSRQSWFVVEEKDVKSVSIDFEAIDPEAKLTVTRNTKPIDAHAKDIKLEPGYNLIQARVEAPDGATQNIYRLQIFRNGDGNDNLSALKVNGTNATINNAENTAEVLLGSGVNMAAIEAAAESENSSVEIFTADGEAVTAATPIESGKNYFDVIVKTETLKTPRVIRLTVTVAENSETMLKSAAFTNAEMTGAFDSAEKEFDVNVFNQSFGCTFETLDADSIIEVFFNGETKPSKTATGKLETTARFDMTKDVNTLEVKVSSADKKSSKTYTFNLAKQASMYVSDLVWEKATSGDEPDNPVRADKATSNNPIRVNDENGEAVEYAKGIGLHADGEVVIDLTQTAFPAERFEALVGVDRNTQSGQPENYPKLVFTVYGINADGEETKLAESGEMMTATPAEKLSCELGDSVKLKLVVKTLIGNVWNAHADWADAKLTTTFESEEEPGETTGTLLNLVTTTAEDIIKIKDQFKAEGMAALEEAAAASKAMLEEGTATQEEMNKQAEVTNDALLNVRRVPTEDALKELLESLK